MKMGALENNLTKLLDLAQLLAEDDPEYGTALLLGAAACIAANRETFESMADEAWNSVNGETVQ